MYKIKEPTLQQHAFEIKKKEKEWGKHITYIHVPRAENKDADRVVNIILDQQKNIP
jgi:hypothetical protein